MSEMVTILPPVTVGNAKKTNTPVFIEYSPEYKRAHGISNEIDRIPQNSLEKTPNEDTYENFCEFVNPQCMKAMKLPSPTQIAAGFAVLPVIIENGKKILIGIFDIRDIWNERSGGKNNKPEHQLQAFIIPDEIAEAITPKEINPEA
jgi:hypothetical protein